MKKRILALAIAVVMIVSMLPITASATTPMPKFRMYDPAYSSYLESYFNQSNTVYVVYEDVLDEDGVTVLGNKPVIADETPTDNYIKFAFDGKTAIVTMKNISYKRTAAEDDFLHILRNAGSSYDSNFGVKFVLEGENTVEGTQVNITLEATGAIEITGSGSLTINNAASSNGTFWSKYTGDLLIKDTTVTINQTNTNTGTCGNFIIKGAITVENSDLTITCSKATAMITGTKYATKLEDTTKGISFTKGSNVYISGGSSVAVQTNGQITIDNSSVTIQKGTGNKNPFASSMPYLVGNFSSVQLKKNVGSSPSFSDASKYEIAEGTTLTTDHAQIGFKTVHECVQPEDDGDCTTAVVCGCEQTVYVEAAEAHSFTDKASDLLVEGTNDTYYVQCDNCSVVSDELTIQTGPKCPHENAPAQEYCDVAVTCPDCNEVVYAAKSHTPGEDDDDCTTAVACTVCGKDAIAAKEHTPVKELDNCTKGVKCADCAQYAIEPVASHTGGEDRPCGEHRTCEICGQLYGAKKSHSDKKTAAQAATCTEAGHAEYWTCEDCGKIFADSDNTIEITDLVAWLAEGGDGYIAATDHTEDEPVIDPENNDIVVSCSVCGAEISRTPAEGTVCEHTPADAVYTNGSDNGWHIKTVDCAKCGENISRDEEECSGGTATCENAAICQHCEQSYGVAKGHAFNELASNQQATPADCENAATYFVKCDNCDEVSETKTVAVGEANGHAFNELASNQQATPADCENAATYFVKCDNCDEISETKTVAVGEANGHAFNELASNQQATPADCKNAATYFVKCDNCDEVSETKTVVVGDVSETHAPAAPVSENINEASLNAPGSYEEVVYCSVCEKELSRDVKEIPQLLGALAQIDGVLYATLQDAIDAAQTGDVILLRANVKNGTTLYIPEGKDIVINFKDRFYAVNIVTDGAAMVIAKGATVTLREGKLQAEYSAYEQFDCVINNAGALTTKDFTINGNNMCKAGAATIVNSGELNLNAGTVINVNRNTKTALINTGSVTKAANVELEALKGYHWSAQGTLEAHNYEKVTNFAATCEKVSYDLHECACGDSYEDNFGTNKLSVVAKIGDKLYASMEEAIAAAAENDVIVLNKNVKDAKTIIVPAGKKITINMNGKYYAVNDIADKAAMIIEEGAEVILIGGSKLEAQNMPGNKDAFDAVIKNYGKLTIDGVTINAKNLYATDFAIINEGNLVLKEGAVLDLIKASAIAGEGEVTDETAE